MTTPQVMTSTFDKWIHRFQLITVGRQDLGGGEVALTRLLFGAPYAEAGNGIIPGSSPLSVHIDIDRQLYSMMCSGKFTLYNLNKDSRALIFHDKTDIDPRTYMPIQFYAGYVSDPVTHLLFQGNITAAYSTREPPNWKTAITAYDGMYAAQNGQAKLELAVGGVDKVEEFLGKLLESSVGLKDFKGASHLSIGFISDLPMIQMQRGFSVTGSTWKTICDFCDNYPGPDGPLKHFILDEKIYILSRKDFGTSGPTKLINARTGLLKTPMKYGNRIDVSCLFDPEVTIGQLCSVESSEAYCNVNNWQVFGYHHHGLISPTVQGDLQTDITLYNPAVL